MNFFESVAEFVSSLDVNTLLAPFNFNTALTTCVVSAVIVIVGIRLISWL